ncbi:hypothetical protein TWF281_001386 [Arthrobotrys megalospora]
MSNNNTKRGLNALAPPWGIDEDPLSDDQHDVYPLKQSKRMTPTLPAAIYPPTNGNNTIQPSSYRVAGLAAIDAPLPGNSPTTVYPLGTDSAPAIDGTNPSGANDQTRMIEVPIISELSGLTIGHKTAPAPLQSSVPSAPKVDAPPNPQTPQRYAQPLWSAPIGDAPIPFQNSRRGTPALQAGQDTTPLTPIPPNGPVTNSSLANQPTTGGSRPNGPFQAGARPNRAFSTGSFPSGFISNGSFPNGPFPNDLLRNALFPNGLPSAGLPSSGFFPNESFPNGGFQDGSIPNSGFPGEFPNFVSDNVANENIVNGSFTNRNLANGSFTNRNPTDENAKNQKVPAAVPQIQQPSATPTPESVMGEMRKIFTLDPLLLIERGIIPTLGAENWLDWAIPMQRYLKSEGLWAPWGSDTKYQGCPQPKAHERRRVKYSTHTCTNYECSRRDRIDALALLIISMTCDRMNRNLVLTETTMKGAWSLLEDVYTYKGTRTQGGDGPNLFNHDFEELNPVTMLERGEIILTSEHSLSEFFVLAYKQYGNYLDARERSGVDEITDTFMVTSEQTFLVGLINQLPDQYEDVKDYWRPRLKKEFYKFSTIYSWILAKEKEGKPPRWGLS